MTRDEARKILQQHGMTISRTPYEEWRVNFKGGKEGAAYYATDLKDAVGTGIEMARRGDGSKKNPRRRRGRQNYWPRQPIRHRRAARKGWRRRRRR